MSTTIHPTIARSELADVRWLAAEAVADAVAGVTMGPSASGFGDGLCETTTVLARAWALGAVGLELEEPTPGGPLDALDLPWPADLGLRHISTLLDAADDLEDRYRQAAEDDPANIDGAAYWWARVERIRRARASLRSFGASWLEVPS